MTEYHKMCVRLQPHIQGLVNVALPNGLTQSDVTIDPSIGQLLKMLPDGWRWVSCGEDWITHWEVQICKGNDPVKGFKKFTNKSHHCALLAAIECARGWKKEKSS